MTLINKSYEKEKNIFKDMASLSFRVIPTISSGFSAVNVQLGVGEHVSSIVMESQRHAQAESSIHNEAKGNNKNIKKEEVSSRVFLPRQMYLLKRMETKLRHPSSLLVSYKSIS